MQVPVFKVVLVGDGGVGKTAFVKRFAAGELGCRFDAAKGAEVRPLEFSTSVGNVIFNVLDTAGQEHFAPLRAGF
jgi:GTP-binding nuclear protein Ran